jgi:ubiquinone/menaquinone biosynthesis C-methylase UbiE
MRLPSSFSLAEWHDCSTPEQGPKEDMMSTEKREVSASKSRAPGRLKANRWFAAFWDWMSAHEPKQSLKMRKEIVGGASGRVLEIGCGTGASFAHYPQGVQVVATEPDSEMLKRAERHIKEKGLKNIELRRAAAQDLPFDDGSFDTVVSCLVFCHVGEEAPTALAEIKRLLKPDGRFRFMEHVRNDESRFGAKLQDVVNPVWKRCLGAGCNCNRRTQQAIEAAGFEIEWVKRQPTFPPTSPVIYGVARPG